MGYNWKHYLPGIFSFLVAGLILLIPSIAVFLVLSVLVTFGVLYIFVVYQIHKGLVQLRMDQPTEPKFKDVTVYIVRQGQKFYGPDS